MYGELNRYPLYVNRYVRIIEYWFEVLYSNNCIAKAVYTCNYLLNDAANGKNNWASCVKTLLCSHGFPDVLITLLLLIANHSCVFLNNLYVLLSFNHGKGIKNRTKYYARSITILQLTSYDIYLDKVTFPALRPPITQMRTSGHILRIETGHYGQQRLERFEKRC